MPPNLLSSLSCSSSTSAGCFEKSNKVTALFENFQWCHNTPSGPGTNTSSGGIQGLWNLHLLGNPQSPQKLVGKAASQGRQNYKFQGALAHPQSLIWKPGRTPAGKGSNADRGPYRAATGRALVHSQSLLFMTLYVLIHLLAKISL